MFSVSKKGDKVELWINGETHEMGVAEATALKRELYAVIGEIYNSWMDIK